MLLSSHILAEVEALCDRVTIIRAGQHGRDRHAGRAAPPHPHLDRRRDRAAADGPRPRSPGVHDLHVEGHRARFDVDTSHLDEALRRLAGVRRAQPDEPRRRRSRSCSCATTATTIADGRMTRARRRPRALLRLRAAPRARADPGLRSLLFVAARARIAASSLRACTRPRADRAQLAATRRAATRGLIALRRAAARPRHARRRLIAWQIGALRRRVRRADEHAARRPPHARRGGAAGAASSSRAAPVGRFAPLDRGARASSPRSQRAARRRSSRSR